MGFDVGVISLSKGMQISLPAKIRKKHKLKAGTEIEYIDLDNEIILKPKKKTSLKELIGACKGNEKDEEFDVVKEHDLLVSGFD